MWAFGVDRGPWTNYLICSLGDSGDECEIAHKLTHKLLQWMLVDAGMLSIIFYASFIAFYFNLLSLIHRVDKPTHYLSLNVLARLLISISSREPVNSGYIVRLLKTAEHC